MIDAREQSGDQIFDNPDPRALSSIYLLLGGIGLLVFAVVGFVAAVFANHGQMLLHFISTLPAIVAVGMLVRGFSLLSLPSRSLSGRMD